ncbi:MAG: hypothetical protein ED559_06045 [Phycisphaera sp.]|nr:MAG: hypothetical protein ED559_06045 [Phycisphaera sp.]
MTNSRDVLRSLPLLLCYASISGCGGPSAGESMIRPQSIAERTAQPARPAILIANSALSRDALWPVLAELAGKEAIREAVLDHAVATELSRGGLSITEEDVEAERSRLRTRLAPGAEEETANEVMGRVLDRRGIGPARLGALLKRNAGMRRLIADEAEPTAEMLELAHRIRYGRQLETRMIVVQTSAAAQQAVAEIRNRSDELGLKLAFAEVASERSVDRSASLGGDLGPISPDDPGLPVSVRGVLAELDPMTPSDIIALDSGFAVLLIEREIPAQETTLEEVYDEISAEVRERQERLLMDRLAEQLLREYAPSVLDASLRWSWER